jgi:outer membrane PBP1 activator LpoA protein
VADKILQKLAVTAKTDSENQKKDSGRQNSWISETTWRLIDQKASARKNGDTQRSKEIAKELNHSLKKDRESRTDKVAVEIESLLVNNDPKGAFERLKCWYKQRSGHVPKPTYKDAEVTREEYEKLFSTETPPGEDIPIHISPTPHVDDTPPSESEIIEALAKLKLGKAPGATGL